MAVDRTFGLDAWEGARRAVSRDLVSKDKNQQLFIAAENIMEHLKKAGGKASGKPMEITGVGLYESFTDTEDNRTSVLQPRQ